MAKLRSLASEVIEKMNKEGKVKTLSFHETASIDHRLATGLRKVKNQFEVKEKNSRAFVSKIELSSLNQ
jgi:hypothetical protein